MTHKYNITGMTCNGCVAKVKSELLKMGNVLAAEVQLSAPQATIEMDKHIPTAALQQAIGAKYTITGDAPVASHTMAAESAAPVSYYPIFLIFGYIAGITLLIEYAKGAFVLMEWMSAFMAGFFLLFSFFKLLNLPAFAQGYATYDVVAKKIPAYGFVYPFIELLLGIAYLVHFNPLLTNVITLLIMGISTIGVAQSLIKKIAFQCACLGTIIKLPLSKVTLFEDLLMVAMSLVMIMQLKGVF